MTTVRITADTSIRGVPAFSGAVMSVDEADARSLIENRKAELCAEASEAPAEDMDKQEETRKRRK